MSILSIFIERCPYIWLKKGIRKSHKFCKKKSCLQLSIELEATLKYFAMACLIRLQQIEQNKSTQLHFCLEKIYRGSYMSALVLLNLLNKLRQRNKNVRFYLSHDIKIN